MKDAGIMGYRELTEDEIAWVNRCKEVEVQVGELWRDVVASTDCDRRWTAIAKTHFQEGFSALVRSMTKPEDVF